ncbi:MAG: zinc ribbon domain-containing protein [Chloroflexi bacterium]|nr:zinc ribbon domain-containing protein [Chloroflexota bacterium]
MPIYEYRCNGCGALCSFFIRSMSQPLDPVCQRCGSPDLRRAISRFAYHKTLQQVHEESGPPPERSSLDYYKDPRNIGRHVEESFKKWDVDVPKPIRETIDAAREGVVPEELGL